MMMMMIILAFQKFGDQKEHSPYLSLAPNRIHYSLLRVTTIFSTRSSVAHSPQFCGHKRLGLDEMFGKTRIGYHILIFKIIHF
jgi:hypothetical protein